MDDIWTLICIESNLNGCKIISQLNSNLLRIFRGNSVWRQLFHRNFYPCDLDTQFNNWYEFYKYVHKCYRELNNYCKQFIVNKFGCHEIYSRKSYVFPQQILNVDNDNEIINSVKPFGLKNGDIIDTTFRPKCMYYENQLFDEEDDLLDGKIFNEFPMKYWLGALSYHKYDCCVDVKEWEDQIINNSKLIGNVNVSWFIRNYVKYIVVYKGKLIQLNGDTVDYSYIQIEKYCSELDLEANKYYPICKRFLDFCD